MSEPEKPAPRKPSGLGDDGSLLWDSIIPKYDLRPDELRILLDACREADLIGRIQAELEVSSLVSTGSMGQEVASPFVSEIRQHRAILKTLLAQLKLPDTPAQSGHKRASVSDAARKAARARWGSGAGSA